MKKHLKLIASVVAGCFVVFLLVNMAIATWQASASKPRGNRYQQFPRLNPVIAWTAGGAADSSLYVGDIRAEDRIISCWYFDTTKFAISFTDHTSIVHYQANDSIRDSLTTAAGYLMILFQDGTVSDPNLTATRY